MSPRNMKPLWKTSKVEMSRESKRIADLEKKVAELTQTIEEMQDSLSSLQRSMRSWHVPLT